MHEEPPERLGPYRISAVAGRGGMGVVYRGEDTQLGRPVAVKTLPAALARDPRSLERFLREARMLAAIEHPGIATIHTLERDENGNRYLILEWVDGETLEERLAHGPLGTEEALAVAGHVAAALAAAHERGVVHRDLKPGNVMTTGDGRVKVLDFGIALRVEPNEEASNRETVASLTEPGLLMGTPGYMSPEQLRGGLAGPEADVFAFGCLLFECLAGSPCFPGSTPADRVAAALTREPPWESIPPETPGAVRALLVECLAKNPGDRPENGRRLRARLERLDGDASPTTRALPVAAVPHNLPAALTRFLGRESELTTCRELLETHRLLTLTGAGGCGKTRLSLELSESALDRYPDGVWFVDLATVRRPREVPRKVAEVFGVREVPGTPIVQILTAALARRRALVVLDNCEHVRQAAADLTRALLARSTTLTILATSRETLGLEGEQAFRVPSLPSPEKREESVERLAANPSVRLFLDRAALVRPGFVLDAENAADVAEICRRLDGIPLALELAAARVRLLAPRALRARLEDRFRLLADPGGGRLPRHRTLRAAIDWSHDLLDDDERHFLRALSVFVGGASLEAAAAVALEEADELEALDRLAPLVDKSLVQVETGSAGETRYRLLETMREYLWERACGANEGERLIGRHVEFCMRFAASAEAGLAEAEQGRWLVRLDDEHENLLAAVDRSLTRPERTEQGLELASTLWRYWEVRGRLGLASRILPRALQAPGAEVAGGARARALSAAGNLAFRLGDYQGALARHRESLEIARAHGDDLGVARCLNNLGLVHYRLGEYDLSRSFYEEALERNRRLGRRDWEAIALSNAGIVAQYQGDAARARSLYEQALTRMRELGNRRGEAVTLGNLGALARVGKAWDEGVKLLDRAIEIRRELGDRPGVAIALANQGALLAQAGRVEEAAPKVRESLALHRELGAAGSATPADATRALDAAGFLLLAWGAGTASRDRFVDADAIRARHGLRLPPDEQSEKDAAVERAGGESERTGSGGEPTDLLTAIDRALAAIDAGAGRRPN